MMKKNEQTIVIVLDGPPAGKDCGRFVRLEDEHGEEIFPEEIGTFWIMEEDGYYTLRLTRSRIGHK